MENEPLDGLRVVDLSTGMAGAQAVQFLVEAGAEAVAVEPPGGNPLRGSAAWPAVAGGKRSVQLDLHLAADREVLDGLLARADVLVTTMDNAAAERAGLTPERLAALNPRLVSAAVTGWGSTGPWAGLPGWEGLVMAKIGIFHAKERMVLRSGPAFTSVPYASWGAAQTAVHGILAALVDRETSGRGQHVEADLLRGVGMIDTWNWFGELVSIRWPGAYESVDAYDENGEPLSPLLYPLLIAPTKDGHWLQFAQTAPRLFAAFVKELGLDWMWADPKWKGLPRLDAQELRTELWEIMIRKVGERTLAEWTRVFETNKDIFAERYRIGAEVLDHPQLVHDGRVVTVEDPERGPVRRPSALVHTAAGDPLTPARPAPRLDEHGAQLRAEAARPVGAVQPAATVQPAAAAEPAGAPVEEAGLPLAGVTVLDLGSMFAAPFGSALLADLGARVIKVEPLTGDNIRTLLPFPESAGIRVMQGKESVCVDFGTDEGRALVHELARRSDIVLQSYRAGVAERAAMDADTLRALNPDLIYISAPGYGTGGPDGTRPAYAPSIGAAAGMTLTDAPHAAPDTADLAEIKAGARRLGGAGAVPTVQADGIAALAVASTMLLGLLARARRRPLPPVVVTMLSTATHALLERSVDYPGRPAAPLVDDDGCGFAALYRMYRAAEGWVFLAAPREQDWRPLAAALERITGADLAADARFADQEARTEHDAALVERLSAVFAERPAEEWERLLTADGVGCVRVTESYPERYVQTTPELAAELAVTTTHPIFEEHLRVAPPFRFSRSATRAGGGCLAGDHTDAILRELGHDASAIADLRDRQIVS